MVSPQRSRLLRGSLRADAVVSGACGLIMLAGAGVLTSWLGVPAPLLRAAGLILLPFAVMLLRAARTSRLSRTAVQTVIVLNLAWVAGSVLLLVGGWIELTMLGMMFVIVQAAVVGGLAELQYAGLRQAIG